MGKMARIITMTMTARTHTIAIIAYNSYNSINNNDSNDNKTTSCSREPARWQLRYGAAKTLSPAMQGKSLGPN